MRGGPSSTIKRVFIALALSSLLPALLMTKTYLLASNTLDANGRWISGKTQAEFPTMGAYPFVQRRQTLAQERLNLAAWHGFQEVVYRERFDAARIQFDFLLEDDAYLLFIFDDGQETFSGIRLSVNPRFDSAYLVIRKDGRFNEKHPLTIDALRPNHWHHAVFERDDKGTRFYIDGSPLACEAIAPPPHPAIGFRGCFRKTLVDNVQAFDSAGTRKMTERFRNTRNGFRCFTLALLLTMGLVATLIPFLRLRRLPAREILFSVIAANAVLMVLVGAACAAVYLFGGRYPATGMFQPGERKWVNLRIAETLEHIQTNYPPGPHPEATRVFFLGTSQTYGGGASKRAEAFVPRLQDLLNSAPCCPHPVECINGAIPGADSLIELQLYEGEWLGLQPDLAIVNLSNNDKSAMLFAASLRRIVELNEARGIKTLFVLEPNSIERNPGELKLHPVMRRVAQEDHVPLLDMHECLKDHYDDGILWWDAVHPTSYGHSLIASHLLGISSEMLQAEPAQP